MHLSPLIGKITAVLSHINRLKPRLTAFKSYIFHDALQTPVPRHTYWENRGRWPRPGKIVETELVVGGLLALLAGGELLVKGAVAVAARLAMPPMLIGLTVVGFGTSLPELLVSVDAAWRGLPDIALGNVVGSNIANVLLIGGLAAVLWPIHLQSSSKGLLRDCVVMLAAALVLWPLVAAGGVGRSVGAALFLGLVAYLILAWRSSVPEGGPEDAAKPVGIAVFQVVAGLVLLIVGARLLVDGAVTLARGFGVSEAFIGLTIVAVGTSLPELVTSVVAALRRQSDIAVGNIIGSNIFNILGIMGVTSVISPVAAAPRFAAFDVPVMIAASGVFVAVLLLAKGVNRLAGAGMLAGYATYLWLLPI